MGRSSLSGLAGKRFRFWIVSIIVAMKERERERLREGGA
jgi:hypothetical protein